MYQKTFVAFVLAIGAELSLAADNTPVESVQDVVGCWERIVFSEEAQKLLNVVEPWPAKYQWYCFAEDGTLNSMSSSEPMEVSSESLLETLKALPKDISYEIPQSGIILTKQPSANQNLAWGASFYTDNVLFDGIVVSEGTLVMTLYSSRENKIVYHRYLKRVE